MKHCFILVLLLAVFTLPCPAQSGIDYFKGAWTVTIKDGPKGGFFWRVKEALDGSWLAGSVERGDKKVTNDYWRQDGKKIKRFVFSTDGLFVEISSPGWDGDKLLFTGAAGSKSGKFNVRETITRINSDKFLALWERQGTDGKWVVFSDEVCGRRQN